MMELVVQILESLFDFPYLLQIFMPKQKYIIQLLIKITRLYYQDNSGNPISITLTTFLYRCKVIIGTLVGHN